MILIFTGIGMIAGAVFDFRFYYGETDSTEIHVSSEFSYDLEKSVCLLLY